MIGCGAIKGWLKWSLALVVLTFVWLYIPAEYTGVNPGTFAGDRLATIDSRSISVTDFRRRYMAQVQAYRSSYGGNLTDDILQQMQVPQQVLQQMIQEKAELSEAERAGITVSDAEVRAQIIAIPGLQENGQFIGEQRYRQLLAQQTPPMTPADFEQSVRESLMLDKFRAGLTEWMTVSDAELEREYKRRNEKVTLDVVAVLADNFKTQVNPTDAEISGHYDKEQRTVSHSGSPENQVRADQSRRDRGERQGAEGRRRAKLQRAARQIHDTRTDSREPHPVCDRRQGRERRPRAGRAGA